jgi:hypothetical protein
MGCFVLRTWRPLRRYAVWHDRALFHFMSTDQDRDANRRTFDEATGTERPVVIIAAFARMVRLGAPGLQLPRYSAADLEAALGTRWQMINESAANCTRLRATSQPFTWTAFRRQT